MNRCLIVGCYGRGPKITDMNLNMNLCLEYQSEYIFIMFLTAWKVSVFGVILVCILPHTMLKSEVLKLYGVCNLAANNCFLVEYFPIIPITITKNNCGCRPTYFEKFLSHVFCSTYLHISYCQFSFNRVICKWLQFIMQLLKLEEIKTFMCLSLAFLQTKQ